MAYLRRTQSEKYIRFDLHHLYQSKAGHEAILKKVSPYDVLFSCLAALLRKSKEL